MRDETYAPVTQSAWDISAAREAGVEKAGAFMSVMEAAEPPVIVGAAPMAELMAAGSWAKTDATLARRARVYFILTIKED